MQALDRLYGQAERWLDQLQNLERMVEVADQSEAQTELRYRVGALWEGQLADTLRAVEAYRDVLHHEGAHEPTMEALARIAHGESEPMSAARVLEPIYEELAEWEKLVGIYEVMAENAEDPVAKIEWLHKIADTYERRIQAFDKAFDAYARALEIDVQDQNTVDQMQRLAEVTGDWEKFSTLLTKQAEDMMDPVAKVETLKRVADIQLHKLSDVDGSIARYTEVLEGDPDDRDAIEALDHIFTHLERWPELVENLRRRLRSVGEEAEAISIQLRMGQIYQQQHR